MLSLGGALSSQRVRKIFRLLEADLQYVMDERPYAFQSKFPHNLAFMKYRLGKLAWINRKVRFDVKFLPSGRTFFSDYPRKTDCLKPKNRILSRSDNTFLYIRFSRRSDKAQQEEASRCCVDIVVETLAADFGQSPALECYFPD